MMREWKICNVAMPCLIQISRESYGPLCLFFKDETSVTIDS